VQGGSHLAPGGVDYRPADEVDGGQAQMQAASREAIGDRAAAQSGGSQLDAVHVTVLKLREARDLHIARPAHLLKPNNRATDLSFFENRRVFMHLSNQQQTAGQFFRLSMPAREVWV
jgi:hypothetical protein